MAKIIKTAVSNSNINTDNENNSNINIGIITNQSNADVTIKQTHFNYNELDNLPKINDKTIIKNHDGKYYGLVDAEEGKGLSTNDFTDEYKNKLDEIDTDIDDKIFEHNTDSECHADIRDEIESHISNVDNPHQVTKEQIGLGNADNTSDLDKPISIATQSALELKVDKVTTSSRVYGTDSLGNQTTYDYNALGKVDDVLVDGTSVVTNKIANLGSMAGENKNDYEPTITGAATTITSNNLTENKVLVSDSSGKVATSNITSTELGCLDGIQSNIQLQLDDKVVKNNDITSGTATKITYDSKGLVTAGADITLSDVTDVTTTYTELNQLHEAGAVKADFEKLAAVTASASELNVLDGITVTTSELNQLHESNINKVDLEKLHDITADASELNILDGATLTTTELNYVDGVTSPIQTQIGTLNSLTTDDKTSLQAAINEVDSHADTANSNIGTLNSLTTDTKSTLVSAINEVDSHTDANTSNITNIQSLIPNAATSLNQLADKDFVNSSIATNTANFIGTFNNITERDSYSGDVTNNDYCFVINSLITDNGNDWSDFASLDNYNKSLLTNLDYAWVINGSNFDLYTFNVVEQIWELSKQNTPKEIVSINTAYNRYKATVSSGLLTWEYEYTLNNSSFTASQWASINSGATEEKIDQITINENAIGTLNSLTTTTKTDLVSAINELDSDKVEKTNEVSKVYGTDSLGNQTIYNYSSFGKVDDVTINGVSVVTNKIANIVVANVAISGEYSDLINKPTIGNGILTIQKNGTTVNTFDANSSTNVTANITVPTSVAELSDASNYALVNSLSNVATSGEYNDLINTPTFGSMAFENTTDYYTINASNQAYASKSVETNKVSIVNDINIVYGTDSLGNQTTYSKDSFGMVDDVLLNGNSIVSNKIANIVVANVAISGEYSDLINKPTIPVVDQTYNALSTNAQSGIAVESAITNVLPSQSGNNGKYLTTNGINVSWEDIYAMQIIDYTV